MTQVLHFGAGNIGRGFIAPLLFHAGFKVCFTDANHELVAALQEAGAYEVHEADANTQKKEKITGISAIHVSETASLIALIKQVPLITTAVGAGILPKIAPLIAEGLKARKASGQNTPLHLIACENKVGATSLLEEEVRAHLDSSMEDFLEKWVRFPNCAVDRIVPPQQGENPVDVVVEPFFEWVVDERACITRVIDTGEVTYTDNLPAFIERKLFTLNTAHLATGVLGLERGYETISRAIEDPDILAFVRGIMQETGAMLAKRHGFSAHSLAAYHEKIIRRFENPYVVDAPLRVLREPLRKLSKGERVVAPIRLSLELETPHAHLLQLLKKMLVLPSSVDKEAEQLHERIKKEGEVALVSSLCGEAVAKLLENET